MSKHTIAQLVQIRMHLANLIDEKTKEMKASIEEDKKKLNLVELAVLDKLNELGLEKAPTEFGTASKDLKESFSVEDKEAYFDWIKSSDSWHFLDARVNAPNAKTYVKEHQGELPPGIKYSAFMRTKYRKPTKKPI